ncbi:MAG: dTDP-4-dehydrorhamnose reductase [Elusimicrobiales bacterium]
MRYLITGASGQLALEFVKRLPYNETFAFDHSKLDISNERSIRECIDYVKPDVIINCAAYNLVDKAEIDYENAYKVNAVSLKYISDACQKYKTTIVHFSTDYVFGDTKDTPYNEYDEPRPLNKYGLSKLEGEKILSSNTQNYLIFRVSWVYGYGKQNFIYKLLRLVKEKKEIRISTDEVSVPVATTFIVENVLKALSYELKGLWHLVPLGWSSRYDFAKKILEFLNLDVELKKAKQSDFSLYAKRPHFSAMDSSRIQKEFGLRFDIWERYLYDFLKLNPFKEIV